MYIKTLDDYDMSNLKLKVKKLYMYFLACDENQSNNRGLVSYKHIKYLHSNDIPRMVTAIEDGLDSLYSEYFDRVDVTCRIDNSNGALVRLLIDITVHEDDESTTLSKEINLERDRPTNVIEYFNKYVD